jgi:hypothetical protein
MQVMGQLGHRECQTTGSTADIEHEFAIRETAKSDQQWRKMAAPLFANVASVTGVDLTDPFVEFARGRNADPRISFQTADARALPFENNSFDRVFSTPRLGAALHRTP